MRIFVPATPAGLAAAVAAGELGPAPVAAFAVTGSLRESFGEGDEEELALVATEAAAWESLRLLADQQSADHRRLVLTAEVSDGAVAVRTPPAPLAADGGVLLTAALPLTAVLSVLADPASLRPLVAAAVASVAAGRIAADVADVDALAADPGLAALDEVLSTPLLWFDAVEIPHLFPPSANQRSRP